MEKEIKNNVLADKIQQIQLNGNHFNGKKYTETKSGELSDYQNFLYKRALFGLSVYTDEEIKAMNFGKRTRIIKVHRHAQNVLNIWKQQIVNKLSTHLFVTFFPKTEFAKYLMDTEEVTDVKHINKLTFHDLKISKKEITDKLIKEGILPKDYYELKTEPA